ncbi:PHP domain-containing protein [Youngiibacter fragilis]|uniref:Hydrolase n=1 Tax=Youngiibacter fragilis 232.1 TaxID=994573 RepID=V7I0T9_9CLOT|nr:PHP domain-containing protein [Youngiibacter fragilis]ETA79855.1 hydrolase [Youngiibacter fragilis 232.1]
MKLELHCHTTASDGKLTPDELMALAASEGLDTLAVTDHDTTAALPRLAELSRENGIQLIPGIELTTSRNDESIHVLGYFTDDSYRDPELCEFLQGKYTHRNDRVKKMLKLLKQHFEIDLDYDEIRNNSTGVLTRVHVAKEITKLYKQYTLDYIFDNFISKDSPAYVENQYLPIEEGLSLLRKYNCIAVLAHPVIYKKNTLEDLLTYGFDGLECYYFLNSEELTNKSLLLAREKNLLVTAGSDYHGIRGDKKHGYLASIEYDPDHLVPFLSRFGQKLQQV